MDDVDKLEAIAAHLDAEDERRGNAPGQMQSDLRRIAGALAATGTRWAVLGGNSVRLASIEAVIRHPDGIVLKMSSGRELTIELDDDEIDDLMQVLRS